MQKIHYSKLKVFLSSDNIEILYDLTFQAIACAVQFDDQHCGIYAGDQDSYEDFADVFDPLILEYHGLKPGFKHQSNMNVDEIKGNVDPAAPVKSTRYRIIF